MGTRSGTEVQRVDLTMITIEAFNMGKTSMTRGETKITSSKVSGLGDDAYYYALTSGRQNVTELHVKKGSAAFIVYVHRRGGIFSIDQVKAMEKNLAQDVLAKL